MKDTLAVKGDALYRKAMQLLDALKSGKVTKEEALTKVNKLKEASFDLDRQAKRSSPLRRGLRSLLRDGLANAKTRT